MKVLSQVFEKYTRDRAQLPPKVVFRKATRYLEALALSPFYLRGCTKVGARARVRGQPFIENLGRLIIGDDFNLFSGFVQSHLVTGHQGTLEIKNEVSINFGAAISAHESVTIGNRVRMGPYAIIMDSDYHTTKNRDERPSAPIVIEDDVWLALRVSVLKGSKIGKGAVITAGSVVSGVIPPMVVAGGVPARVLRSLDPNDPTELGFGPLDDLDLERAAPAKVPNREHAGTGTDSIPSVVKGVVPLVGATGEPVSGEVEPEIADVIRATFGIEGQVSASWGMSDIPKWDSLGQLRLVMALEERFQITISEDHMMHMNSIERVRRVVRECTAKP